jgi:hypothetical protein
VIWGGRGNPDTSGDAAARGTLDSLVDYIFGGKGGASTNGAIGSDIMDWHPRGAFTTDAAKVNKAGFCTTNQWPMDIGNGKNVTSIDPCSWFLMTNLDDDNGTQASFVNNQHHQGIDWQYGGWDRDIFQGDVADNGPNLGDRLLDWTGAYNLYTHCNAAYGGYNDVRQLSPEEQAFLQQWSFATGIGQGTRAANGTITGDVMTANTSAYDELALVYTADIKDHGNGQAFPTTPGHFDNPNACAP